MENAHKHFQTLRARAALAGVVLWRACRDDDGGQAFFAMRGREICHLPTISDVEAFLGTIYTMRAGGSHGIAAKECGDKGQQAGQMGAQ